MTDVPQLLAGASDRMREAAGNGFPRRRGRPRKVLVVSPEPVTITAEPGASCPTRAVVLHRRRMNSGAKRVTPPERAR